MAEKNSVKTFLWFGGGLEEALAFYKETFGEVKVHNEKRHTSDGALFTAEFSIYGHEFVGMNYEGGPAFNDSISMSIACDGQAETDRLWEAITREGEESQCGWCRDKWGLSWQISPIQMHEHLDNPDSQKSEYAWRAMRGMKKIIIDQLYV